MKPMTLAFLVLSANATIASAEIVVGFGSGANQFNMSFVPIDNPGNTPDTTGSPNPAGAVAYNFNMGKFEVSRDMVAKASAAGNLGITLADMTRFGGNGVNRPATGVSWNEVARFVNWLNTSQGFPPAYKFTTQPGDGGYNVNQDMSMWGTGDAGYNAANPFRNSQAQYFVPSVDEWYKSAYYDPSSGLYVDSPTGSNSDPTAVASGTAAGTAVYKGQVGPSDITLAGGLSLYGTMAQGGNVLEWTETVSDLGNNLRRIRGGSWYHFSAASLQSGDYGLDMGPTDDAVADWYSGFRVASIPGLRLLVGDYNLDGTVDAADYNIWRDSVGEIVPRGTGADANNNGFIENAEYFPWRDHFGESRVAGAGVGQLTISVPEPTSIVLIGLAIAAACGRIFSTSSVLSPHQGCTGSS